MKKSFFTFFIFAYSLIIADNKDSIVRFEDLVFRNEIEKSCFLRFSELGKQADIIDLFLSHYGDAAAFSSSGAHSQIEESVKELKELTTEMSERKKVKFIYNYIHKRYFKVYKLNNSFSDIFAKGEYNCVSGSAMYAIVFRMMSIPFQIVEAPQHVFLFAYPQTDKIVIETTSPTNGYIRFSDQYMQKYLKYLGESKLVSKEEIEKSSADEIFNKYYFSKQGLTIQELAGIQYANYSYYYLEESNYEKALEEIKKAYYLFPGERSRYQLQMLLAEVLSRRGYKESIDFRNLALFCHFNTVTKKDVSDEEIRNEFLRLTHEQLITQSNFEQYDAAHQFVRQSIVDTALIKEIDFIYHYELSRLGNASFKKKDYEIYHLKAAYELKPKYADLKIIIQAYLAKLLDNKASPADVLIELELFTKNFDFLANEELMKNTHANCLLELAYQAYTMQNAVQGENRLKQFEKLCDDNPEFKTSDRYVEKAYSTAAAYYFKKGNKTKAKEVLKRGTKYAPENFGLHVRYSQIK
jgi:hypothetical protein